MKLYLSSKRLGNKPTLVSKLLDPQAKIAIVLNAYDDVLGEDRAIRIQSQIDLFNDLGFVADELDLRDFYDNKNIANVLDHYEAVWVRGGNIFRLKYSFDKSGFSEVIKDRIEKNKIVYIGESAGATILGPTLYALEVVDDKSIQKYFDGDYTIDTGLHVLEYVILPHYMSDHPESYLIEEVIKEYKKKSIDFKVLRDGEVLIIDDQNMILL